MKKVNKQLNLLIYSIENLYKIVYLIKKNTNVYGVFLLNFWTDQKMNFVYEHEYKNKKKLF